PQPPAPGAPHPAPPAGPAPAAAAPIVWDRLRLQFTRVACIDETNGWFGTETGSDEISIGGAILDTDGNTNKIAPVDLGGSWDDGDVRVLNPPTSITAYSMRGGKTFPRAIFVTLILVERDGNGMQEIISGLVEMIAENAKTILTALLGSDGPIGVLTGIAVGYAIDKIVAKIRSLWDDVTFLPRTLQGNIPSRQAMFAGQRTSEPARVLFVGPGEYACHFQWQLEKMS
ncbi:hypothetical protein K1W54_06915, partial [Micromonospora sp. CPCC 205371]|nr:hypothetical protein [Micromonospora sp. CPCC 205371]